MDPRGYRGHYPPFIPSDGLHVAGARGASPSMTWGLLAQYDQVGELQPRHRKPVRNTAMCPEAFSFTPSALALGPVPSRWDPGDRSRGDSAR